MKIFKILCVLCVLSGLIFTQTNLPQVKPGVEVLLTERLDLIMGKGVGLITNPTGVDGRLESTVDLLFKTPGVRLVALYGPEHGVRGDVAAGDEITDTVDPKTKIPLYSLYGKNRQPSAEMLKGVDVLLYDIQDIGNRTYTYVSTMALAMQAAKENNIPFIILDRPNPLGGNLVEGPVLDPKFSSFIGFYPIPYLYGLTAGELARYFNVEFGINCDLTVVPMKGWRREMNFTETGLEWVPTSPHIPQKETAFYCAATGAIGELGSVNVGIGYTLPFELVGEEWIDGEQLARELNGRKLPGVIFRPIYYQPFYGNRQKVALQGVQIHVTDYRQFQPIRTQIHILTALRKLCPGQNIFDPKRIGSFDKACGTDQVRLALLENKNAETIIASWQKDVDAFKQKSKQYYLYK